VFFKSDSDIFWRVLSIKWVEHDVHPGQYRIKILRPTRNSIKAQVLLDNILRRDKVLNWDEYEDFVLGWARTIGRNDVAISQSQAYIAAWEMFMLCCDNDIAAWHRNDIFFPTIDPTIDDFQRAQAIDDALRYCDARLPGVYAMWSRQIECHVFNHCSWLAELVAENGCKI
jgi:hypothetical protein